MSTSRDTPEARDQRIPLPAPADWSTGFEQRQTAETQLPYEEYTGALEISPNDTQQYRLIRLPNNMVALCVRNDDVVQSSACLSMLAGSMANPPEFLGMAHFCEHLLTMGSKKYPKEKEYSQYITSNAGYSNAETTMYDTKYFFKVSDKAFEGALDRFAQIFIDPLFDANSIDRELNSVQSEFQGYKTNDTWRTFMVAKKICRPDHPFSRFCVGTVETLKGEAERRGVDLRDELIKFYEQYYSSDIMRLVVYGNHSLDQLTEWAVSKFSAVPSKGDTRVKLPGHLLTKSELGRMIRIQSLDKVYVIRLVFPFEDMHPWFKEKPVSYVRSLLAHTGVGSLAHYLKKRGWSHAIEADNMSEVRFCDNIMGIIVSATKEGMAHWQDVVRAVFAYIQVLKKEGPQQWFYDEISTSRATKFRFRQAQSAISLVTSLSEHMHDMYVPPSNATSTIAQLREFNAPLISHYLDMLNPDNMCIFFLQQDFDMELTETEPHMDVKYRVDAIGQEFLSELRGELLYEGLHLPDRNPFISENLDMEKPAVLPEPTTEPVLLKLSHGLELWFKRDDQFFLPRGDITLHIETPKLSRSPQATLMGFMFDHMVGYVLEDVSSSASAAGIDYTVDVGYEHIYVTVYGLSDKLMLVVGAVLKALKSFKAEQELLDTTKALFIDYFKNKLNEKAGCLANREMRYMTYTPCWLPEAILREFDTITVSKIQAFTDSLFENTRIKMLVVGNYSEQDALGAARMVVDTLKCTPLPQHLRTSVLTHWIETGSYLRQIVGSEENSSNSAVKLRVYLRNLVDTKSQAMCVLLSQVLSHPFTTQLRTQEQLGYSVDDACYMVQRYDHRCLEFNVMGECNPAYILLRIREFLKGFRKQLVEMTEDKLATYVQTLSECWLEKKRNLTQEGVGFWSSIQSGYYAFDIDSRYAKALKSVTKEDLVAYWDKHMDPATVQDRTEIAVQVWAPKLQIPSTEDVAKYPATDIALHQCLHEDNATELSLDAVHRLVGSIEASSDDAFETLLARCVDMAKRAIEDGFSTKTRADIDVMASKLSEPNSRVRTALAMAVEHAAASVKRANGFVKGHSRLRISEFGDFRNVGMLVTPENVWVVPDSLAFKNAQTLLGLPVPTQRLVPKYQ